MRTLIATVALALCACGGGSDPILRTAEAAPVTTAAIPTNWVAYNSVQAEFTQYRDSAVPLRKLIDTPCWFGGGALTANTNTLYVGGMRRVALAHWRLAIIPNGGSARLVAFDGGPQNIKVLAEWGGPQSSPISAGAYVTAEINALIDSGLQHKHIGLMICGSAVVYLSDLQLVWGDIGTAPQMLVPAADGLHD